MKLKVLKLIASFLSILAICIACNQDVEMELNKMDELGQAELDKDMEVAHPIVSIQLNPKKVSVGQPITITVVASAGWGLDSFWWWGNNTGISDLDKAHSRNGLGSMNETAFYSWTIYIQEPGTYRFGANSRDTRYKLHCMPGGHLVPHQASEAAGISFDEVTVTEDSL